MLTVEVRNGFGMPVVKCDHCNEKVESAAEGDYGWLEGIGGKPIDGRVIFCHTRCLPAFRAANPAPNGEFGLWFTVNLDLLPMYLEQSLGPVPA